MNEADRIQTNRFKTYQSIKEKIKWFDNEVLLECQMCHKKFQYNMLISKTRKYCDFCNAIKRDYLASKIKEERKLLRIKNERITKVSKQ